MFPSRCGILRVELTTSFGGLGWVFWRSVTIIGVAAWDTQGLTSWPFGRGLSLSVVWWWILRAGTHSWFEGGSLDYIECTRLTRVLQHIVGTSYPFFVSFFLFNSVNNDSTTANKPTTPGFAGAVMIKAPVAPGVDGESQVATKV